MSIQQLKSSKSGQSINPKTVADAVSFNNSTVSAALNDINNRINNIDNMSAHVWYYDYDPTLSPDWDNSIEHIGDIWFNTDTGISSTYISDEGTYKWISDSSIFVTYDVFSNTIQELQKQIDDLKK